MNKTLRIIRMSIIAACAASIPAFSQGLPGEYLINSKWRVVGAESSPLTNPAFIIERSHPTAQYTGSSVMGDFMMQDLGVSLPLPLALDQSLGISWLYQGTGEYDQTVFDQNTFEQTKTGSIVDNSNVFTLTYALSPLPILAIGANVNLLYQNFADLKQSGYGVDAGVALRIPESPVLGKHVLGLAMQNLISPSLGAEFARTVNISWYGRYWERQIITGADLQLKDLTPADGGSMTWQVNAKVGAWPVKIAKIYGLAGLNGRGVDYLGAAMGLNLPAINQGRDLEALYQYIDLRNGGVTHSLYIQGEFGWNREDIRKKLEEQRLNAAPMELYRRGVGLYNQGKYWEAYFTFGKVQADYPRFRQMDAVEYYAGRSLEALDMREAAIATYEKAKNTYPRSDSKVDIALGLMRVYYREKNTRQVDNLFGEIFELEVPDSIKFHAYYLRAQVYMQSGEYASAQQLFEHIPQDNPTYIYAMFSSAIADQMQGNARAMRNKLVKVTGATGKTAPADLELINRGNLMLGNLYLEDLAAEDQSLAGAVTAFRKVPQTSRYYAEAQVGLAWTAIKARNWKDCIVVGTTLLNSNVDPVLRAEGALVAGFAYFTGKDYEGAQNVLEKGQKYIDEAERNKTRVPSTAEMRAKYNEISRSMMAVAGTRESDTKIDDVMELRRKQQLVRQALDESVSALDAWQRENIWRERIAILKTDIGFTLANAMKRSGTAKKEEIKEKSAKKAQAIEDEILKLEKEMKQLK